MKKLTTKKTLGNTISKFWKIIRSAWILKEDTSLGIKSKC